MTDREEHQEIGRIVSEHKAAKRKYQCHLGKANVMSRRLRRLAKIFESVSREESPIYKDGTLVVSGTEKISVPTRDEIIAVLDGVSTARATFDLLEEERKGLEID